MAGAVRRPAPGLPAKRETHSAPILSRLEPASLREQARQAIWAQIVTGDLQPGVIYPVSVFATRLGVSATPVREALLELANAGLIEAVRNRGFRVPALRDQDFDELFEIRLLLEVPVMRGIAKRLTPRGIDECRTLARRIVKLAAARDLAGFLKVDREFHLYLLRVLGNRRLLEIVSRLRDEARLYGLRDLAHSGQLLSSAKEHQALLDALQGGDGAKAEKQMLLHLRHTRGIWAGRREE